MKKLLSSILASSMILSMSVTSFATEQGSMVESLQQIEVKTLSSGTCGANATWSFNSSTGTLTISGTGEMADYPHANGVVPWHDYKDNIKSAVITEGITSIGEASFLFFSALKSVTIPDSVTLIGKDAFTWSGLTSVTIPNSVSSIGYGAFSLCGSLTSVTIPDSVTSIGDSAFDLCESLTTVYYGGSEADRAKMMISDNENSYLKNATWIYTNAPVSMPDVAPQATPTYPDWASTFTNYVTPSIMPDMTTGNYDNSTTRGMIAQYMYNLAGNGATGAENPFTDGGEYAEAIAWCNANGVMNGTSDTQFGTDTNVSREQFALILQKAGVALGKDGQTGDVSALNSYGDVNHISFWAKDGMAWAVSNGLMSGSDNQLNPTGGITRIQVAVMLYNFNIL